MSEEKLVSVDTIRAALVEFDWDNYRLHDVHDTLDDDDCQEWADDLARHISRRIWGAGA